MPSKRLTRVQQRERTRQRLLVAAASRIAEKGWAATSVEDIAAHAGYTRGAFYSNFGSKRELFVELLRLDHRRMQEGLRVLLGATSSIDDLQARLASLYSRRYRDSDSYIVWAEARLHAMRDAAFRQCLNALFAETRDSIAQCFERSGKRVDAISTDSCADYALAVIAIMDGLCHFNLTVPDALPDTMAEAMLNAVIASMCIDRRP